MNPSQHSLSRSPESMSATERVAEIGQILATGYRRRELKQIPDQVCLADTAPAVALCDAPVNGLEPAGTENQ